MLLNTEAFGLNITVDNFQENMLVQLKECI